MKTGKRTPAKGTRAAIAAVAVVLITVGCAPYRPAGRVPVSDEPIVPERTWSCLPLDGPGVDQLAGRAESWTAEGGSMLSVHRTRREGLGPAGVATQRDAMAGAAASAADAALELLDQRGVAYNKERRQEIIDEVVGAAV
ncbi:MAG: hypothetical protein KAJ04_08570, partial [Candidatus Eisenbacteria sp.]|nr:hypothetical protein [Candidatus Eisenbacteria bacterium]